MFSFLRCVYFCFLVMPSSKSVTKSLRSPPFFFVEKVYLKFRLLIIKTDGKIDRGDRQLDKGSYNRAEGKKNMPKQLPHYHPSLPHIPKHSWSVCLILSQYNYKRLILLLHDSVIINLKNLKITLQKNSCERP